MTKADKPVDTNEPIQLELDLGFDTDFEIDDLFEPLDTPCDHEDGECEACQ